MLVWIAWVQRLCFYVHKCGRFSVLVKCLVDVRHFKVSNL